MENIKKFAQKIIENIEKVIIGKTKQIYLMVMALFSKGHILINDLPGLGKTYLARSLAITIGGEFKRIQGTPDLLPSDIIGVSVFNPKTQEFEFKKGPLLSQIILVDEINRATPKTQSALLEAMAEGQVSVEGKTYKLSDPFIVIATQNPVEFEGTFPLPEAQRDRFFISIELGYPDAEYESAILEYQKSGHPIDRLKQIVKLEDIVKAQELIKKVYVENSIKDYIVNLVSKTRENPYIVLGASPRGSLALYRGAQAFAAMSGRDYVIPDDIKTIFIPIIKHRIILKSEARLKGVSENQVLSQIIESEAVPIDEKQ